MDAMRLGMGEMTYPEVRANFEARIASGEFREVCGTKHSAGRHFTTVGTIQAEKEIIRSVRDGQGRAPQLMSIQDAIPLTEAREQLNTTQRKAIEQILTSRDQIQGLQGSAGSGKTTTLSAIRQGAEQNGYTVEGFAPTSRRASAPRSGRQGNVSVPLFTGGRIRSDIHDAEAALVQRRAEYRDLKGRVEYDIRTARLDVESSASAVRVAIENQSLADKALVQSEDRYRNDVTNYLEVLEAQQAQVAASENYIVSLFSFNVAKMSLARALGDAESHLADLFNTH